MTPPPSPSDQPVTEQLATWLTVHMARTRRSPNDIARELGITAETVRLWLRAKGGQAVETNEFAHLDTPAKLGEWLRGRIADSGRSVRRIADETEDVSMGTIYNWLKGEHLPPPPAGEEPDRFDLLLSHPALELGLRQRVQLDEIRRRLTGTSVQIAAAPPAVWPTRALPAGNRSFSGRGDACRRLDRLLSRHARSGAVVISALTGMGGVGKTALAVHWARSASVRATFTDGCLYLDLNGYSQAPPLAVGPALRKLLFQLGVAPRRMPADLDALGTFYQEILAGRRLLIILDNAHAEPQVRPLLPNDPACLAVVTSRNRLQGLDVTHGPVTHLRLDVLTARESASLLRRLLGALATKAATDEDLDALAETCGRLPLALQIAAANYLTHAHPEGVTLAEYIAGLQGRRLDTLAIGATDPATAVTAALDHSYRHLTEDARRTYRLLGLHPGPDCSLEAAASLTAHSVEQTRTLLSELAQANLLTEHRPGRHAFHDLVREHAVALADRLDSGPDRRRATRRMLDHYVHTAHAATLQMDPGITAITIPLHDPEPGVTTEAITDRDAAVNWFETEHPAVTAVAARAAGDLDAHVWQAAWALCQFFLLRGSWHELIAVQHVALAASQRLDLPAAQAYSHRLTALADTRLGDYADSRRHLERSLALCVSAGDKAGQAATYKNLGHLAQVRGDLGEALDHTRRAVELYREAGLRFGEARALNSIGWYHALLGEYAEARDLCEQALDLCVELDYPTLKAGVWDSLGYVHHRLGDHVEALAHYRRARDLYHELGDRFYEADTLSHLGDLHLSTGDTDAAREAWGGALAVFTELEHANAVEIARKLAELDTRADES